MQLNSPAVMSTEPAELGVHLHKQNLADVIYSNLIGWGADLAIPLLFAPPHFSDLPPALPIYAGMSSLGVPLHPHILADKLTLSQPGGQIMPT